MLYIYYWCKDEEERKELKKTLIENEKKYQKELEEKYEVFKNDDNQINEISNNETESEEEFGCSWEDYKPAEYHAQVAEAPDFEE